MNKISNGRLVDDSDREYVLLGGAGTIGNGSKNVTTAGTDVALSSSSVPCRSVAIMAKLTNTGYIAVGSAGVDATVSSGDGVLLAAGDTMTIDVSDLNLVYIDSTVNGEGVRYTYIV